MFPEVLVVPVYFPIVAYLLWREVGPSCLVALAIVVLQPPVQYVSLRLYAKWRCVGKCDNVRRLCSCRTNNFINALLKSVNAVFKIVYGYYCKDLIS